MHLDRWRLCVTEPFTELKHAVFALVWAVDVLMDFPVRELTTTDCLGCNTKLFCLKCVGIC